MRSTAKNGRLYVTAPRAPANGKKILIVDDDQVIRKTVAVKLEAAGYTVMVAEDGPEAVRNARNEGPDLMLLDISFPPDVANGGGVPWDGFLIMDWLKGYTEAKDIPIIVISGEDPARYEARALSKGARCVFQKPLQIPNLLAAIDQVLQEREQG